MEKTAVISILVFIFAIILFPSYKLYEIIYVNLAAILGISLVWIVFGKEGGIYFLISMYLASVYATTSLEILRTFKELPSPIIGGDYYAQLGQIHYMNRTLDIFGNHYYSDKIFSYNPIYSWLAVIWMKISGMNGIDTMKFLSTVLLYLNIVWYIVAFRVSNSSVLSLGVMVFSMTTFPFILKYTELASQIVSIIILYLLHTGVYWLSIALSFISHFIVFVFTGIFLVYRILLDFQSHKNIVKLITDNLPLILVGFAIVLILITRVDLTDHFPRMRMDFPNYSQSEGMDFLVNKVIIDFLWRDLMILPILIYLFTIYKKPELNYIDHLILIFTILVVLSPVLDRLFRVNAAPSYSLGIVFKPLLILGVLYRMKDLDAKYSIIAGIVFMGAGIYEIYNEFPAKIKALYMYQNNSLSQMLPHYVEVIQIVSKDPGVVLTNKPISFLINAYTGTHVVTSRWAQSFHLPFLNFSKRDMDAAIMLYSDDRELAQKLLREYRVKYIVFDREFSRILEIQGNPPSVLRPVDFRIYIADPLMCMGCESVLKRNNISYITGRGWLDPSIREPYVDTFEVYIVDHRNYPRFKVDPNYRLIYENLTLVVYKLE